MAALRERLCGSLTFHKLLIDSYGSVEGLISQAKSGVLKAQEDLGTAYAHGVKELLIPQDSDQAIRWLSSAVDNGCFSLSVLHQLGTLYDNKGLEEGSRAHHRKAYELYHRAAKFGSVHAQFNLGEMYRCGVEGVVNEDLSEAFKWFKLAAGEEVVKDSHPLAGAMQLLSSDMKLTALHRLYKCYLDGDCPEQEPQPGKALYYLEKAAEQGNVESQRDLGHAHMTGSCSASKDLGKAERWLEKAAKKGDMESQKLLEECRKEAKHPSVSQDNILDNEQIKQTLELKSEKLKQCLSRHPFAVPNPIVLTEEVLRAYPDSPTAQMYLKAYKLMEEGLKILRSSNYTNKYGLTCFAQAFLIENTIKNPFLISQQERAKIIAFASSVLSTGDPTFFEGTVVTFALTPTFGERSIKSAMLNQANITVLDNLIHLIQMAKSRCDTQDKLDEFDEKYGNYLHELFYFKGSLLTISELFDKAAEAFGKALELCPSNFETKLALGYSLYHAAIDPIEVKIRGEAFRETEMEWHQIHQRKKQKSRDTEQEMRCPDPSTWGKVKQLYEDYLENAPKCAKKYPNACYHMARFYMRRKNIPKMQEYFRMGQDAEETRLPFLGPVDISIKHILSTFCQLIPSAKCSNPGCTKKDSTGALRNCPCHKVFYCDRECQLADWKNHKSVCTVKKNKKRTTEK